jgi:hypothetical protein
VNGTEANLNPIIAGAPFFFIPTLMTRQRIGFLAQKVKTGLTVPLVWRLVIGELLLIEINSYVSDVVR